MACTAPYPGALRLLQPALRDQAQRAQTKTDDDVDRQGARTMAQKRMQVMMKHVAGTSEQAECYPENLDIETLAPVGLMASATKGETGSLALQSAVRWTCSAVGRARLAC